MALFLGGYSVERLSALSYTGVMIF